jgi:hypothetical protein
MANMRAFLLDHATALGIPCHRFEGLGASLTLHLTVCAMLAGSPLEPAGRTAPTLAVTYVTEDALAQADTAADTAAVPAEIEETPAEGPASDGAIPGLALALPEFDFDITKVGRAGDLFPFLSDPLVFLDEVREKFSETPDRLLNPFGPERQPSATPPLVATDAQLQHIVDRAWSRRDRWSNFEEIAGLLTKHDPHDGSAFLLLRRYLDQNLLQPYYDTTTRDPRFWVMLGLAADHERLIEFIGSFVRRHPSSRTTTELLFMLDEFAQASRDTLLMLLSSDPDSHLDATRDASIPAFELAMGVHRRYDNLARDRGLRDTKSIRNYFDDVRLRILRTIIETTPDGYGAADARFLAGRILWEQNRVADAFEWWTDLSPDDRNAYAAATDYVRKEVAFRDGQTASEISRVLGQEYRRWLTFSEMRLREFGYEFDTF